LVVGVVIIAGKSHQEANSGIRSSFLQLNEAEKQLKIDYITRSSK
jgi:hypothetical protein